MPGAGLDVQADVVTVPFVLLLLDYWPLGRFRTGLDAPPPDPSARGSRRLPLAWRLVVEKIPLLALSAATCGMVLLNHASLGSANTADQELSLATRVGNALVSYAAYLRQSFYPVDLAPLLSQSRRSSADGFDCRIAGAARGDHRARGGRVAPAALPAGGLALVSGNVGSGPRIGGAILACRADRYTYLSQIGLSIALAWGVWSVYRSWPASRSAWPGWLLAAISARRSGAAGRLAWRQTGYWRNAEKLFTHTVSCTEQNVLGRLYLGAVYLRQDKIEEAIAQLPPGVGRVFGQPRP